MRLLSRVGSGLIVLALMAAAGLVAWQLQRGTPLEQAFEQPIRVAVARVGQVVHARDRVEALGLAARYRIGDARPPDVAVVFERPDAPHLVALRERYALDRLVAGAATEYDAMLRLAEWMGVQFPHATDPVPGGNYACATVEVIEAGARGRGFWCEIAARTMTHAALALGWLARTITASRDAWSWEHAVAELWSNQFDKWFVVDTDYNVVFEVDGVPLSTWELVHRGPDLQRAGRLVTRRFAPVKPGITPQDLVKYFAYAHVDLRTDWCTRDLRRGSPGRRRPRDSLDGPPRARADLVRELPCDVAAP